MVDGLLIAVSKETDCSDHILQVIERAIPLLMFERVIEELPVSGVRTDDLAGGFELTEHLIRGGSRRIAHITGPETLKVCCKRLEGYQAALTKPGRPLERKSTR